MAFLGEVAELAAILKLTDQFSGPLKKADQTLGKFDAHLDKTASRSYKAGQQIGTGIQNAVKIGAAAIVGVTGLLALSAKEGQEAQNVQIKYATAIQNSGKISAAYVKILDDQALALSNLAGADDEAIRSSQTRLIQMGLTGEQVKTLTPLILDASIRTGKDLDALTLAVGRAAQGSATSLGRLGIIIPKTEKAQKSAALTALENAKAQLAINKSLDESHGPLTKAEKALYAQRKAALDAQIGQQKLADSSKKGAKGADDYAKVVAALNKSFKGSAAALSGQLDTRLRTFNERLQDIREDAGIKLLPVLTRIVDVVGTKLVPAFGKFIDQILPVAIDGLNDIANFLDSGQATSAFAGFMTAAQTAAPIIKGAAEDTLFILKTAVGLFQQLPPEIQALAIAGLTINKLTGGLVTNIAGGLIEAVIASFKGLMNVNAAVVNVNGPVGGVGAGGVPIQGTNLATRAAGLVAKVFMVGIAAEAADVLHSAISPGGGLQGRTESGKLLAGDQLEWPFGPKNTPHIDLGPFKDILGGDSTFSAPLPGLSNAVFTGVEDRSGDAMTAKRGAFNSVPTRADLRARIALAEEAKKGAKSRDVRELNREIASDRARLAKRIADAASRAQAQARALDRSIQGISDTIRENRPIVNISIPLNIDSRTFTATTNRYSDTFVNGVRPRVGGA